MQARLPFLFALIALALPAAEPTVEEIVQKANAVSYFAGKDGRAEVEMSIADAKGGIRVRRFVILRLNG